MDLDWTEVRFSSSFENLQNLVSQRGLIDNKSYMIHDIKTPKYIYEGNYLKYTIHREHFYIVYGDSTVRAEGEGTERHIAIANGALVALRAIEYIDGVLYSKHLQETGNHPTNFDELLSAISIDKQASELTNSVNHQVNGWVQEGSFYSPPQPITNNQTLDGKKSEPLNLSGLTD